MAHRCACRLRQPGCEPTWDACEQIVDSDDQPYCDSCIENAAHHRASNFDPVPAGLLHTLQVTLIEGVEVTEVAIKLDGEIESIRMMSISFEEEQHDDQQH